MLCTEPSTDVHRPASNLPAAEMSWWLEAYCEGVMLHMNPADGHVSTTPQAAQTHLYGAGMTMWLSVTAISMPRSCASAVKGTLTERRRLLLGGSDRRRRTVCRAVLPSQTLA